MTQAASSDLIALPGDTLTEAQSRFQPEDPPSTNVTPETTADNSPDTQNQRLAASWPRQ
jgi:hypothetical protein